MADETPRTNSDLPNLQRTDLNQFSDRASVADSIASGALAQIPQLESEESAALSKQSQIGEAEAADISHTYQQMESATPPQRNTRVMDMAPLFIGLAAIGGRMSGIHAKTMLSATNGMVQGILQGNEKAFQDAQSQFEQSQKRLMEMSQLRQQYYETLYRAYGDTANAKEKAIKAARDLVNDSFKHDIDVVKAEAQNKALEDRLFMGMQNLQLRELQLEVQRMNAESLSQHRTNQDTIAQEKVDAKTKETKDAQSGILQDIQALKQELKGGGVAGVPGMLSRGMEVAKTATGWGDQDTPAHRFQNRVDAMLLKLPKALTGTSKSAKDERARVDEIGNLLKMGTTGPIAEQKLDELEQIMKHQTPESAALSDSGMSPEVQQKANAIREQVRSGKMTTEQGITELQKLGFQ
jgi:hypothetical protein